MLTPTTLVQKKKNALTSHPHAPEIERMAKCFSLRLELPECELKFGQVYVWAVQQFDLQQRHVPKRSHSNFQRKNLHPSSTLAKSTLM
jgi:hypothetical protein